MFIRKFYIFGGISLASALLGCGINLSQIDASSEQPQEADTKTEIIDSRLIDNGGSGPYKSIAAKESSLVDFVVYRPEDLAVASQQENKLPILVFANGGCNNTSIPHERMLSEVASQGYIVVALGSLQRTLLDRELNKAPNGMMLEAINWVNQKNNEQKSEYYQKLDLDNIAIGGQSCGGAQVLAVGANNRVKTYIMFNSGIGDMIMADANRESLKNLHGPVLYMVGGETDVATANAELDYARINHVPVAFSNLLTAGHGGTFDQKFGGSYAAMTLKWLDWQLKGKTDQAQVFLQSELSQFPGWTMKAKQF
ncbi:poly(ethylene terephthalate) hydrolase family protein [Algibacillus agarilyticus]|uniref:poly(ethylene terephthalate) hydrolase family protein n=1 Tax=Algibacillus agarilyticus TaxID=2234133 RepID=UPI000DCFF56F|nr:alpha/beta hydrolase [Algibacillus agarilyticus]